MKYRFLISVFLLVNTVMFAQTNADNSAIKLFLYPVNNDPNLSIKLQQRIYSKVKMMVSETGIVEFGYSNFFVNPKLDIINTSVSESGMSKIYMTECELYITIERKSYNGVGGAIFSTFSKKLTGSSLNKEDALGNAINSLRKDDPEFIRFFKQSKEKINQYYQQHCTDVLEEAERLYKLGDLSQSVALYFSIPSSAPKDCYNKAVSGSLTVYKYYINAECQKKLITLKSHIALALQTDSAAKHYKAAADIFESLHPASDACYLEAQALIQKIETRLTEEQKNDWQTKRELMKNDTELRKFELKAIGKMSNSYTPGGGSSTIVIQQ